MIDLTSKQWKFEKEIYSLRSKINILYIIKKSYYKILLYSIINTVYYQ